MGSDTVEEALGRNLKNQNFAELKAVTPVRHPRPATVALLAISRITSCPGEPQAPLLPLYIAVIVSGEALTSWP
jgi:hypothetical protein